MAAERSVRCTTRSNSRLSKCRTTLQYIRTRFSRQLKNKSQISTIDPVNSKHNSLVSETSSIDLKFRNNSSFTKPSMSPDSSISYTSEWQRSSLKSQFRREHCEKVEFNCSTIDLNMMDPELTKPSEYSSDSRCSPRTYSRRQ